MTNLIHFSFRTKINSLKVITTHICALTFLFMASASVLSQQSPANNLAPVEKICLLGQECVGTKAGAMEMTETSDALEITLQQAKETEPSLSTIATSSYDAEAGYLANCMACHTTGAAGAPKLGAKREWEARMSKGMDAVMANVINGFSVMPARGLCMTCSDEQLQSIVNYMIEQ